MASSGNSRISSCLTNSHVLLLSMVFVKSSFVWSHSIGKARSLSSNECINHEFHINRWGWLADRVFSSRGGHLVCWQIQVGSWIDKLLSIQPGSTNRDPNSSKLTNWHANAWCLPKFGPVWHQLKPSHGEVIKQVLQWEVFLEGLHWYIVHIDLLPRCFRGCGQFFVIGVMKEGSLVSATVQEIAGFIVCLCRGKHFSVSSINAVMSKA